MSTIDHHLPVTTEDRTWLTLQLMAQSPLNVIALVSGGKDSFLSLLHCLALGHNVVALANLGPSKHDLSADLNSHMYQTAGHGLVSIYSEVLSIPLYRDTISGTALNRSKEYVPAVPHGSKTNEQLDETEDLMRLLINVIKSHPDANAVSCGAILSTYQRTRVESVCLRLGIMVLAYLWQYPYLPLAGVSPSSLLYDVASVGLDARIVKVASGGLDESLLWESLQDPRVRIRIEKAVKRFGGSPLGEGGEFETIVIDGPEDLWKGAIEVMADGMKVGKGEGGEAWLEFRNAFAKPHEQDKTGFTWQENLRQPMLWDLKFDALLRHDSHSLDMTSLGSRASYATAWNACFHLATYDRSLHIANLTSRKIPPVSAVEEMADISTQLTSTLLSHGYDADDLAFTTILLRNMSDFTAINTIYGGLFKKSTPPARATVACGDSMPQGKQVMISAFAQTPRSVRTGLHVQSRSYWAPANIGPYSQAISVPAVRGIPEEEPRIVYIAGQIPLVPATMEILPAEEGEAPYMKFWKRCLLSLQHLWRIGTEMQVEWWSGAIAFIAQTEDGDTVPISAKAQLALELWQALHIPPKTKAGQDVEEDMHGPDIWDLKYGGMGSFATDESDQKRLLLNFECLGKGHSESKDTGESKYLVPGFFAVEIAELPRAADIEWQAAGYSKGSVVMDEQLPPELACSNNNENWFTITSTLLSVETHDEEAADGTAFDRKETGLKPGYNGLSTAFISILPDEVESGAEAKRNATVSALKALSGSTNKSLPGTEPHPTIITIYTPYPELFGEVAAAIVPCARVWGFARQGNDKRRLCELGAGVVARWQVS